jgi:hypothetical protein
VTKRSHPKKREPTVRTKLAKELNVSERKVQQAMNVQKHQPELLKEVQHGKMPLREAAKRVKPVPPQKQPKQPRLRTDSCDQCKQLADGLKALRKEIKRRRAENHAAYLRRRWNVDNINKIELVKLLDYVELELDKITGTKTG